MAYNNMTNKEKSKKAIQFAINHERRQGRNPEDVSKNREHSGYDIKSSNRMIEVKGVGESWNTYSWQSLYKTERECLKENQNDFYLYIIKFKDTKSDQIEGFYIIPGVDLETKFRIDVETYGIRNINKNSLKKFLVDQE